MSDNFFTLDQGVSETIGNPLDIGGALRLPFTVLEMWWKNGTGSGTDLVTKFGGWAINAEVYDQWMTEFNDLPAGISGPHEWASGTDMSKTYMAYAVRSLWVAPIARRSAWFLKQGGDKNNKKDWKSSVEYLCYSANYNKQDNAMVALGPVVLKAKSNNGIALDEAFQAYRNATAKGRKELANNIQAHFFYQCVGTFGPKIITKKVGSQGNQKDITFATSFLPDEITVDNLRLTFVGNTVAAIMADMKNQAADWLADWNKRSKKSNEHDNAEVPEPEAPAIDDDMPF